MTHGGRVYEFAREHGMKMEDILDFSANINPLGPPKSALDAIATHLPFITHYPDATHHDVKAAISERLHVSVESILCGNGATEVMELVFRHVAPRRLLVLQPAFSEYQLIARRLGVETISIPLTPSVDNEDSDASFRLPLDAIQQAARPGDLLVINNPHNPTSAFWHPRDWWPHLQSLCESGVFVAVDESFIDFVPATAGISLVDVATHTPNLFVIKSATKIFSIPGLRFGYGIGHPAFVRGIEADRDGWSVNSLAQVASAAAMRDDAFFAATWHWITGEIAQVLELAKGLPGIRIYKPSVNFVLTEFRDADTARHVQAKLRTQGILSRSCDNFETLNLRHVRFAIRTQAQNQKLWQNVRTILT